MYTRCPKCRTAYRIELRQLRLGRGEVRCGRCQTVFSALSFLGMTIAESVAGGGAPQPEQVPVLSERQAIGASKLVKERWRELDGRIQGQTEWAPEAAHRGRRPGMPADVLGWGAGALVLSGLLVWQVIAFEGRRLVQSVHLRPWLEGICGIVGCVLPPFRDLDQIAILDRALTVARDGGDKLEFSLVFANRSALPQPFPDLALELQALDGRPVAERVFAPIEYLPEWYDGMTMPTGTPFEVHLTLLKPSREVGGFTIAFR
ncbi:DUF3426 domain-containing protein [Candidatus Methylocalor cossyra]|uniref:Zinc finger/thioredoxin putative domain-containing protein n=1 Tax=Candidatus Methylocalor cossyra TaxID=3108543 RepID=A0ABM9NE72_9GAMM